MRIQHQADTDHHFVTAHRARQHLADAAPGFPRCAQGGRPDHRAGVQQRAAMHIVHFQHIAQIGGAFQHVRPGATRCQPGRRGAGASHARQPVDKMPPCPLFLAFTQRPR